MGGALMVRSSSLNFACVYKNFLEHELKQPLESSVKFSDSDQFHGAGALAFDVEYARWTEEQNKLINELRTAVNSHAGDTELRTVVDNVTTHFYDVFRLKTNAAKVDVFHILSGMWKTPAERCFMWLGGFRPSELLKVCSIDLIPNFLSAIIQAGFLVRREKLFWRDSTLKTNKYSIPSQNEEADFESSWKTIMTEVC